VEPDDDAHEARHLSVELGGNMIGNASVERCASFISSQVREGAKPAPVIEQGVRRAVTISRQAGCGAVIVAEKLAHFLQEHLPQDKCPWMVFDRNLMNKVLEDHNLPSHMAKFMPEDRVSQLEDILADVFQMHPPSETIAIQTKETILKLARAGHVIIIGRGGNVITAKVPNVLHVRLVATLEKRIEHGCKYYNMTEADARRFCHETDRARERFLRRYFSMNVDDPLLYHLVINTGLVGLDEAAKLIGNTLLSMFPG
jgi:cytidylate kinase